MPSFLPPAAASSEVLRTLDEQNEAQRNLEVSLPAESCPSIVNFSFGTRLFYPYRLIDSETDIILTAHAGFDS